MNKLHRGKPLPIPEGKVCFSPDFRRTQNRKKVFHLIQSLSSGGCENMLLRTLPLLNNFEHFIITLKEKGELSSDFENKRLKVINVGQKNLLDLFAYVRLLRQVKKNKPDIIFTYLFHADLIGRLIIQPLTFRKVTPFLRTTYNHRKYWAARLFEKMTKYFAKRYLANSQSVKDFYINKIGVSPEKITVIPNGIDWKSYTNVSAEKNLYKELEIKKKDIVITCVANLVVNKGHRYLIKAFEEVYLRNKNIQLLLVGEGPERKNLENQIKFYQSRYKIVFLGRRNDVSKILKISDIFVLPTMFEGMSNAIMEAMATGLVIITTDIPENRELIQNDKNGLLISVKDSQSLVHAIDVLIHDDKKRQSLGLAASRTVRNKYDIRRMVSRLSEYYSSLLINKEPTTAYRHTKCHKDADY